MLLKYLSKEEDEEIMLEKNYANKFLGGKNCLNAERTHQQQFELFNLEAVCSGCGWQLKSAE